jgi:adenylate cyclase
MLKRSGRALPPAVTGLLLCAAVCVVVLGLRHAGRLQALELAAYDRFLAFTSPPHHRDPRILLVTVSEEDIQAQSTWPLPDGTLARLITNLLKHEPRAIGLDLYRDIPVPPGGEELKALFAENRDIVTVRKLRDRFSPGVPPPYMVSGPDLTGFNDLLVDPDGVVRRGLLYLDDGEEVFTAFSLLLAQLYLQREGVSPEADPARPEWLKLGRRTFAPLEADDGAYVRADVGGYQFLLDFSSVSSGFSWISLTEGLEGTFPPDLVRDRVVLIGSWAESTKDLFLGPVVLDRHGGRMLSGVELHAGIVSQLLEAALSGRRGPRFFGAAGEMLWICAWGLAGFGLGMRIRSPAWFVLWNGAALAVLVSGSLLLFVKGVWVPVVPPAAAELASATLLTAWLAHREKAERAQLMRMFSCHLSPEVAESLWSRRDQYLEGGRPRAQELTATVLFTDLAGFTPVAESLDAQALMDWLNEYMAAMTRTVMDSGGVVNKYMGDAVMALFGVPAPRRGEEEIARDARNGVRCALAMKGELERLNGEWAARGRTAMRMRIGIHTGPLMVGCIGSEDRLEYTVIGDTVNVAARLESFDKDLDAASTCRILISETTLSRLDGRFLTSSVGRVRLKGKDRELSISRVVDLAPPPAG